MKSRLKKIIFRVVPLAGLLLAFPLPAGAFAFLGPAVVGVLIMAALYVLQFIGGQLFIWASALVSYVIDLNSGILKSNDLILTGWTIVRDVANLGFVIVIVVMAIATIIRFQSYAAKKLLPKLIAAAILVNFSLAIAGVFIDFSNVLTKFFFDPLSGNGGTGKLVETISGAFDPQKLFTEPAEPDPIDPEDEVGWFEGISTSVLSSIAQLAFTVIFIFIAAFVLLAFALMLLLRYLYLSFLLIIAPIVWLFWVIPALESQFSKWWSKFLKWIFFAPAASFFFYLTLVSFQSLSKNQGRPLDTTQAGVFGATLATQGVRMILLTGLMIGGLIMAEQMGIYGAQGALGLMSKARGGIQKWAGERTKRGWDRGRAAVMASAPVQTLAEGMKHVPGLKRAGFALGAQGNVVRQSILNDAEKRNSRYNDTDLAENLNTLSKPERIAAMLRLAKNNTLKDVPNVAEHVSTKSGNRELFEKYGEGRAWTKEIQPAAGMNEKTADAVIADDEKTANKEMRDWSQTLAPEQLAKIPKELFNGDHAKLGIKTDKVAEAVRRGFVHGIALNNPEAIARYFPKLDGKGQENLGRVANEIAAVMENSPDKAEQKKGERLMDSVEKLPSYMLYTSATTALGGTTPITPPPPTTPKTS